MIFSLSLAAILIAAPSQGKPAAEATIRVEAAATAKAADAAASAAESASRAAIAAEHAAEAAAKAAQAAADAAGAAQKYAAGPVVVTTPSTPKSPEAAPAAPPPPSVTWTSVINLGLIALTGNTQSLAFSLGGNVQRKGPEWIWGVKGGALYGQTRDNATGINTINAEAASVQLRGDKRVTPAFSGYLLAGIDTDHIKNIEERPYGELGASLVWFDVKEGDLQKTTFRTDLGFRYGREYRFQYFPYAVNQGDVDIVAPHLGVGYRYAVNKEIIFTDDLDLVANLQGDARLLVLNNAKIAARLTDTFSLAIQFIINYDSLPPLGKKDADTALTIGVDIAL
jgi:hypothetical protein